MSVELSPDWRVLGFSAAVACASAIVASMAPVFGLKRVNAGEALKDAGRGVAGERRFAVRGTFVVAQVAVSLVLITLAGLFVRSFASLSQLPLGFVPEPLLVAELNLQATPTPVEQRGVRAELLRAAAAVVPGVQSASLSYVSILTGGGWGSNRIAIDDGPTPVEDRSDQRLWRNATSADREGAPLVAIVNRAFVRRYGLDQQPIGRTVRIGVPNGERRYEIVGLVGDSVYTSPRDGMMATMYVPLAQIDPRFFEETVVLTLKTASGQRRAVERDVATELARTVPTIAITFRTFDQFIDATVTQERLIAMLSSFFGGIALLLSGIGLYGIVAQAVRTRQGEIGLRLALGAQPAWIVRLVFRRVGVLIVAGLALGLVGSLWAAQLVKPLLFQVEASDPTTFVGATVVLVTAGVLAAWLPAQRAARLDPASILREG